MVLEGSRTSGLSRNPVYSFIPRFGPHRQHRTSPQGPLYHNVLIYHYLSYVHRRHHVQVF